MNISLSVNFRQLKSHVTKMNNKAGQPIDVLILPIDINYMVKTEKGVYLDMNAYELKERKEGQKNTHIIKQNYPKELFEAMTDQEKLALPIIGNLTIWSRQEPEPRNFEVYQPGQGEEQIEHDDLPF